VYESRFERKNNDDTGLKKIRPKNYIRIRENTFFYRERFLVERGIKKTVGSIVIGLDTEKSIYI